jgi:hypothetical protein
VVAVLVALSAVIAGAAPAGATVTSLSSTSATVAPGGGARTTARVSSSGVTCVSASPSSDSISVDVSPVCSDADSWSSTITVSTSAGTPPGTYTVRINDDKGSAGDAKTFTLRVEAPTTTTAPPETTTTVATPTTAPTTTAPTTTLPTTTTAPTTTTTTAPAETTTTMAPPPPGGGFVTVASQIDAGLPAEGVFLPLESAGYRNCLPLTAACVTGDSALVLVPARTTDLTWRPLGADQRPAPSTDLRGVEPLGPVGTPPADPGAQDYAVPILDLEAPGGQLRSLLRGLDEKGQLRTPRGLPAVATPTAEGPAATPESRTFLSSAPFGRPRLATKGELSEAAPAVPLFSSTQLQVVYAVRPDPSWGLNVALLPMFGSGSVPYLVRGVDGPPGLYVARPAGLRIPVAGSTDSTASATEDDGGGGGNLLPLLLLGAAVVVGAGATAALAIRRRRRREADEVAAARRATEEARARLNRPRGTSR